MNSRNNMVNLISRFRNSCLEHYSEDINVLSKEQRDIRLGPRENRDLPSILVGRTDRPIDHICRLAKTPRLLKIILRR